jgi:hypothetical protein
LYFSTNGTDAQRLHLPEHGVEFGIGHIIGHRVRHRIQVDLRVVELLTDFAEPVERRR